MRKEEMRVMKKMMRSLETEWERTGTTIRMLEFTKDEITGIFLQIIGEAEERSQTFEAMGEIPFGDSLKYSHENYILLRLGRKVEKAMADMQKKGSYFAKIFVDKEELKMYEKLTEVME